jgi:hypothetical protein
MGELKLPTKDVLNRVKTNLENPKLVKRERSSKKNIQYIEETHTRPVGIYM